LPTGSQYVANLIQRITAVAVETMKIVDFLGEWGPRTKGG